MRWSAVARRVALLILALTLLDCADVALDDEHEAEPTELVKGSVSALSTSDIDPLAARESGAAIRISDDFLGRQTRVERVVGGQPRSAARAATSWTIGPKRALYMRVDFPDRPGGSISEDAARAELAIASTFFQENSGGLTWLSEQTVTPVLRLSESWIFYAGEGGNMDRLLQEARNAAFAAGYDTNLYDLDLVAFTELGYAWAGSGMLGAKGTWLQNGPGAFITVHELGHNLGLMHSSLWVSSDYTPFGSGTIGEYGNQFDVMGVGRDPTSHFSAHHKLALGWLTESDVPTVTGSGRYRILAHDLHGAAAGIRGVRIPRQGEQSIFLEYRGVPAEWMLPRGALVNLVEGLSSLLIDPEPRNGSRMNDSLEIGRTLADPISNIFITSLAHVELGERDAVDVLIQRGPFPANRAPSLTLTTSATRIAPGGSVTFTASASDPDGDPLVYHWDFDNGQTATTSGTVTMGYYSTNVYVVRLEVSDTKGGRASRNIAVRVGQPFQGVVSGIVREGPTGPPLEGVAVYHPYGSRVTDSTGRYYLTAGGGTYPIAATLPNTWFSPRERVVRVDDGAEIGGIDFFASRGPLRIDSGGGELFVDTRGQLWSEDYAFSDGIVVDRGNLSIAGTREDRLYQTERFGLSSYSLPVSNGSYSVKLHFAETYDGITGPGQRLFDVRAEDTEFGEIDVFARAGGRNRALVVQTNMLLQDGMLDIVFTPKVQNTMVSAIELGPVQRPQPIRVDCGSDAPFTDESGLVWERDRGFVGGIVVDRGNIAIADTNDDRLYQTERFGMSEYAFSVPNGRYRVTLHMAETYAGITAPGQRVFDVMVNGVLTPAIDLLGWYGASNAARQLSLDTQVSNGSVRIGFTPIVQNTLINAIEILPLF